MNAVVINSDPSAPAMTSTRSAATGTIIPVSMMPGLSAPTDSDVPRFIKLSQIPAGMSVSRSFSPGSGQTMSFSIRRFGRVVDARDHEPDVHHDRHELDDHDRHELDDRHVDVLDRARPRLLSPTWEHPPTMMGTGM